MRRERSEGKNGSQGKKRGSKGERQCVLALKEKGGTLKKKDPSS